MIEDKDPGPCRTMTANECAGRQSVPSMLRETVERLRRRAHDLESLAFELEKRSMGESADMAMYEILCRSRMG